MRTKIAAKTISGFVEIKKFGTLFKIVLLNGRVFPPGNTYLSRDQLTDEALEHLEAALELERCSVKGEPNGK